MSSFVTKQRNIIELVTHFKKGSEDEVTGNVYGPRILPTDEELAALARLQEEVNTGTWRATDAMPKSMPTDSFQFSDGSLVEIYDPTRSTSPTQDPSDVLIFRSHNGETWFELSPDQDPI
jgi:hypothetical protein